MSPFRGRVGEEAAATVRLVNAILLSALKKQASEFRVVRDDAGQSTVDFCIAGVWQQEMQPPDKLHAVIVRRLAIMTSLPMFGKDQAARGEIHLVIGDDRHHYFRVHVEGHGHAQAAYVRVLRNHSSSGSGASSSG